MLLVSGVFVVTFSDHNVSILRCTTLRCVMLSVYIVYLTCLFTIAVYVVLPLNISFNLLQSLITMEVLQRFRQLTKDSKRGEYKDNTIIFEYVFISILLTIHL